MIEKSLITVDLDGTMTKFREYIFKRGTEWFNKKPMDVNGYGILNMYDVTREEEIDFWASNSREYYRYAEMKEGSVESINWLMSKGHSILFLTHRYPGFYCGLSMEELIDCTKHNLISNGIKDPLVHYVKGNKSDVCKSLKSRYHIDDASGVIMDINESKCGTKSILMKEVWSEDVINIADYYLESWDCLKEKYEEII